MVRSLDVLAKVEPKRWTCVARELTKRHQEFRRGPVSELAAHYALHAPKGEITLVIAPSKLPKWFVAEQEVGDVV